MSSGTLSSSGGRSPVPTNANNLNHNFAVDPGDLPFTSPDASLNRVSAASSTREVFTALSPPSLVSHHDKLHQYLGDLAGMLQELSGEITSPSFLVESLFRSANATVNHMKTGFKQRETMHQHAVAALEERLSLLQQRHDSTAQRLIATTTRLVTTLQQMHSERVSLRGLGIVLGAGDDELDDGTLQGPIPGPSSPPSVRLKSIGLSATLAAGQGSDEVFSLEDAHPTREVVGQIDLGKLSPLRPPPPAPPQMLSPRSHQMWVAAAATAPALTTMRIFELANDALWSRRQLEKYMHLIAHNPPAVEAHHTMLGRFTAGLIDEADTIFDQVAKEMLRQFQCARIAVSSEL